MKILKKVLKILLIILITLITLFIINYLRINIGYLINKNNYVERINIYGVDNNYVPQGLAYSEAENVILETSYNGKHECSQLYVIDFDSGKLLKSLELYNNGKCSNGHVGGITVYDNKVYITYDYKIELYDLEEIINTNNSYVNLIKEDKLLNRGDFCYYDEGILWIGDFYLKPFYDVPDGNPLLYGYEVDNIEFDKPDVAISLPKMVQGMLITKDKKFIFSRSFTYLINSKLTTYKNVLEGKSEKIKVNGKEIDYYKFTKENLIKEESLPPMSEGMFYKDEKAFILFESNSSHYKPALPKIKKIIELDLKNK